MNNYQNKGQNPKKKLIIKKIKNSKNPNLMLLGKKSEDKNPQFSNKNSMGNLLKDKSMNSYQPLVECKDEK